MDNSSLCDRINDSLVTYKVINYRVGRRIAHEMRKCIIYSIDIFTFPKKSQGGICNETFYFVNKRCVAREITVKIPKNEDIVTVAALDDREDVRQCQDELRIIEFLQV